MSASGARATPPAPVAAAPPLSPPAETSFGARLRRRLRPPRRLAFTREGKYFVAGSVFIGFAAINTSNNLLYLLLGMMLSLIIASGILSEMSLRGLEVRRSPAGRIFARRPFLMGVTLRNGKRRFPSFSVEVEDLVAGRALDKKCYFLKVPAGRSQQTSYRHTIARRGRHAFSGFRVSTRFPFALFKKSRLVDDTTEVLVLPAVHPIALPSAPVRATGGDERAERRGRRGDFHGLREYRDGDDPRDIHWRSTARRGRAMLREHEDEAARRVTLFVDNALPGGAGCPDEAAREALERAISLAASLATVYVDRGYALRVVARGSALPASTAASHMGAVLRYLALLPTVEESVTFALPPEGRGETYVVARRGAPRPGAAYGPVLEA